MMSENKRLQNLEAFIVPGEGCMVLRMNEEVYSPSVPDRYQVSFPGTVFNVDFPLRACFLLSWAYLSCTRKMTDELCEGKSALRANAAARSVQIIR